MEKMLERLEGVAKQLVPLCYVLGLIVGTFYYFTDGAGNLGPYLVYVGGALAIATELHSFLLQRRVLVAWTQLRKATDSASEDEAKRDLAMYGGWLAALLAFQIFTSIMYRAALFHPVGGLAWVQVSISGAVIPLFFFGVAFLANVVIDPADVQAATQRTTAMQSAKAGQWVALRALRAARRSFEYRLRQAEKGHADLTGLAVAMQHRFQDTDGAHTLMVIDSELRAVEGQKPRTYAVGVPRVVPAPVRPSAAAPSAGRDLTTLSNGELLLYMEQQHALGLRAQRGEVDLDPAAYAAEMQRVLAEVERRRLVGPQAPQQEPGRVERPADEEMDALVASLGGVII